MEIKFKLYVNWDDEFCLGIFGHPIMVFEDDGNDDIDLDNGEFEKKYRLVIGLAMFTIELIW